MNINGVEYQAVIDDVIGAPPIMVSTTQSRMKFSAFCIR
jgi:hypothetical protein